MWHVKKGNLKAHHHLFVMANHFMILGRKGSSGSKGPTGNKGDIGQKGERGVPGPK